MDADRAVADCVAIDDGVEDVPTHIDPRVVQELVATDDDAVIDCSLPRCAHAMATQPSTASVSYGAFEDNR